MTLFKQLERWLADIERDAERLSWGESNADEFVAAFAPDGPSVQRLRIWRQPS